jgi:hypothetical protein
LGEIIYNLKNCIRGLDRKYVAGKKINCRKKTKQFLAVSCIPVVCLVKNSVELTISVGEGIELKVGMYYCRSSIKFLPEIVTPRNINLNNKAATPLDI